MSLSFPQIDANNHTYFTSIRKKYFKKLTLKHTKLHKLQLLNVMFSLIESFDNLVTNDYCLEGASSRWRTVQVANRPGGDWRTVLVAKRLGGDWRIIQVAKCQSGKTSCCLTINSCQLLKCVIMHVCILGVQVKRILNTCLWKMSDNPIEMLSLDSEVNILSHFDFTPICFYVLWHWFCL